MDNIEWKDFYIKELFETFIGTNGLQTPTGAYIPKAELKEGNTPRITVRDTNNGIDSYCTSENTNFRTYKNFVSVSFLGGAFYHPYEASLDMKVHALIPLKFKFNKDIANFIIMSIRNNTMHSSYGNQLSSTDLPNLKIMLPIDNNGSINLNYMQQEMKKLKASKMEQYMDYAKKKYSKLKYEKVVPLEEKEWSDFYIKDIFESIKRGKRLKKADQFPGNIPYISSTSFNNGVDGFIGNTEKVKIYENCLSLANSGSVGSCFYEPFKFVASDHVTHLKNNNFNMYIYLFIANQLKKLSEKYNFNREINDPRIQREKVVLPIDKNGKPDFWYMENYSKMIMKKQYEKYVKYTEK